MIKMITGKTGEGKTKKMIEEANDRARELKGHIVYIDSSTTHRFALSHRIRLIEASSFPVHSPNDFFGFICGILSSNNDIEAIFIDEVLALTHASIDELTTLFQEIKELSEKHQVEFIISASCSSQELPHTLSSFLTA